MNDFLREFQFDLLICCFFFLSKEFCRKDDCRGGDCELVRMPNGSIKKTCHCVKVDSVDILPSIFSNYFSRAFVVKHVNDYVMLLLNVRLIHVGSAELVLMLLISIIFVFVHRIIPAKIVEH
jgi:hypothetical protein